MSPIKLDSNTIDEIVGNHQTIYDIYFSQADVNGSGIVSALDAGIFLKQSKLSELILKKIWDLSDPTGKGYLDRQSFYIALKLIALAQSNIDVTLDYLHQSTNAPKLAELASNMISLISPNDHWYIKASARIEFDKKFDSLSPINNKISGNRIKPFLLISGLPIDVLGKIWELSDIDQDGQLNRSEFLIAMQLVAKAKEGVQIPDVLPPSLLPFKVRHSSVSLPGTNEIKNWVVTFDEKTKSDIIFNSLDTDKDGFVNGLEVKDFFIQTGLPQLYLASIWNLCDINNLGKLNSEQFALAMHFINKKKSTGLDPPLELTPDMIPPSFRPKITVEESFLTRELEELQQQVTELQREKLYYEQRASEHDIITRKKRTELSNYELEMDSLFKTLREREINRSEEQKKLNDYEDKLNRLNTNLNELKEKYNYEKNDIENIKFQCSNMETNAMNKENELTKIRNELQILKSEKSLLENRLKTRRENYDDLKQTFSKLEIENKMHKEHLSLLKSLQTNLNRLNKEYGYALSNSGQNKEEIEKLEDENRRLIQKIESGNLSIKISPKKNTPTSSLPLSPLNGTNKSNSQSNLSFGFNQASVSNLFNDNAFDEMVSNTALLTLDTNDPFASFDPFKDTDPFKQNAPTKLFEDNFFSNSFDPFNEQQINDNEKKSSRKAPPPRPAPPRPQTPSLKPTKRTPDSSQQRPQSAMDFTYSKKLDLFTDFDPFSSHNDSSNAQNWAAFSNKKNDKNTFDPFA